MYPKKNIFCLGLAGFLAFAAVACCCTEAAAKTSETFSQDHSCCPKKAKENPSGHSTCPQCQHQLTQATKTNHEISPVCIIEKVNGFYAVADEDFQPAFSAQLLLSFVPNGPPEGMTVPLYLKSHNFRL